MDRIIKVKHTLATTTILGGQEMVPDTWYDVFDDAGVASLMRDTVTEVIEKSDIIVVGHKSDEFKSPVGSIEKEKIIIDLVRAVEDCVPAHVQYEGICW